MNENETLFTRHINLDISQNHVKIREQRNVGRETENRYVNCIPELSEIIFPCYLEKKCKCYLFQIGWP